MTSKKLGSRAVAAGVLILTASSVRAQTPRKPDSPAVDAHVKAAAAIASGNPYLTPQPFRYLCAVPQTGGDTAAGETGAAATVPPFKAFDQLYYLGLTSVGAWALTTSDGIILFDTLNNAKEAQEILVPGIRNLGLDPSQIKYIVITHGHGDHYGGAKYLQDTFHSRILMGPRDWDIMARDAADPKNKNYQNAPKHDMDVTDGQILKLGNTSVTLFLTPGHTLSSVSALIPVTDNGQPHVMSFWGGTALPATLEATDRSSGLQAYERSLGRFVENTQKADGFISNHVIFDQKLQKAAKLRARRAGDPNPFVVGTAGTSKAMNMYLECARAAELRLQGK